MKNNLLLKNYLLFIALFALVSLFLPKATSAAELNSFSTAICDQYNNRVIVYDIEKKTYQKRFLIPSAPKGYQKKYSPTDAKIRYHEKSGKDLVLITTGTTLYIYDINNGYTPLAKIKYVFPCDGINVHSVDMSPDGTICIADPTTGSVVFYKLSANLKATLVDLYYEQTSAHSVSYDSKEKCFWTVGYSNIYKIPIENITSYAYVINYTQKMSNDTSNKSIFCSGHCMIQNPNDENELLISGYQGIIRFNKITYKQSVLSYYWGVKGFTYYDNKLLFVRSTEKTNDYKSWTSPYIYDVNSKVYFTFSENGRAYKIIPFVK